MNERRTYGDVVAHIHRLDGSPALITRSLPRSQIGITRISCSPEHIGMKAKIPAEDTFIVALHLTAVEHHELWSDGRPVISQGYAPDSLRIVNLGAEFSSYVANPHEALSFCIPRTVLNGFADEAGGPPVADLHCQPGIIDPIAAHLGAALLPALDRPNEACSLFAIRSHLPSRHIFVNAMAGSSNAKPFGRVDFPCFRSSAPRSIWRAI
jgi:AraC family transcriptional regulator